MTNAVARADPVVRVRALEKRYFTNQVFRGLELELIPGEFYALLGRNGSGKSTLMRILAHREVAQKGEVLVLGVDQDHDFCATAQELAFVSEGVWLPRGQRLSEVLSFHSAFFPRWDQALALRLADGFRLDLSKCVGELSRGQQVQLAVVMNLAYQPNLILLDEVTAVLDAAARAFLMRELCARVAAGATVVMATNIVSEVQGFATTLVLLGEGKVSLTSRVEQLAQSFVKLRRTAELSHPVLGSACCVEVGLDGAGHPLYLISRQDFEARGVPASLVDPREITASEVFVYLTRFRETV